MQKTGDISEKEAKRSAAVHHSDERTRELLLRAGKRLFAQKGFDATTVREISEEAGVNISLVSYYFNGKEGLFRMCLETFGQARLSAAQRLLQPPKSVEEFRVRLEMFVGEFFQSYLDEPDLTHVIHRECDVNFAITEDIFRSTFLKVFDALVGFFKAAQKGGIISKDLDILATGSVVFGSIMHFTRIDTVNQKYFGQGLSDEKYRDKILEHLVQIVLNGVLAKGKGI